MRIYWTKQSQVRFEEINSYIESSFGEQHAAKFRIKIFDFLELLSRFPELGTLEVPSKNIRGFQITSQTRIFYRIQKKHITLLAFFDNRQDPAKKPS